MVLFFAFVSKTVLLTHQYFGSTVLHSIKAFCHPTCPPRLQQENWGTRAWEGTQPGQLIQIGCRDVPNPMTFCSVTKAQGKGEEGRTFTTMLFSQETFTGAEALLPRKWLDICLLTGSSE